MTSKKLLIKNNDKQIIYKTIPNQSCYVIIIFVVFKITRAWEKLSKTTFNLPENIQYPRNRSISETPQTETATSATCDLNVDARHRKGTSARPHVSPTNPSAVKNVRHNNAGGKA